MGVMSRQVLPVCGRLCFFCPSLRARSRQPVKRYKKLIADIFPRSQNGLPNERMMAKLCEYTSKNLLRIPKITYNLDQKFYKEMRSEHYHLAKVVPCIYSKMLASCKEQMPLFATSMLSIVRTLLDQTRRDDLRILGCLTLVDFINSQVDSMYMFNLEGLIPKVCQVCQPIGGDKSLQLLSAGLQALASMVRFMGEYSHMSMEFHKIVSVTLENYAVEVHLQNRKQDMQSMCLPASYDNNKAELSASVVISKSPTYWSRVCLQNMANLAKEATTMRRVLEPLFHSFDEENYWSPDKGIAYSVLSLMQNLMQNLGKNSDLLLSMVKHLDHRNVAKQINVQVNIINIITQIAQHAQIEASVPIFTAISDLMRHLRKCLQCSIEASITGEEISKWNSILHSALEGCLVQLIKKVGDVGPILDMMAVVLENLPSTPIIARTTVSSVFRVAQIVAFIPNLLCEKKAFPEALFHQLVLAMSHPDHETRVGSHRIFSAILAPSVVSPWSIPPISISPGGYDKRETLFVALSGFSSSETILEKLEKGNHSLQYESRGQHIISVNEFEGRSMEGGQHVYENAKQCTHSASIELHTIKISTSSPEELTSMRLSSHQLGILLSSVFAQASSEGNNPSNYEAMAHSYNLALFFSRTKASSHVALVHCFQLAFSLRIMSRDYENYLQPSRRRSLYTLASSMLIMSAKAGDLPHLVALIMARIMEKLVDPYLNLVEESRLQAVVVKSQAGKVQYGSEEDEASALKFLEAVKNEDDDDVREMVSSHLVKKYESLSEQELINIKQQLSQEFSPYEVFPLNAPMFKDTPDVYSPLAQKEAENFDEVAPAAIDNEDSFSNACKSQSDHKILESKSSVDILSVNQLIESVLETARLATALPVATTPVPYEEMKSQCEALVVGKQQKMSVLLSFKSQKDEDSVSDTLKENEISLSVKSSKSSEMKKNESFHSHSGDSEQSLRLPPSSPYDKFLKAAGW